MYEGSDKAKQELNSILHDDIIAELQNAGLVGPITVAIKKVITRRGLCRYEAEENLPELVGSFAEFATRMQLESEDLEDYFNAV